MASRDTVQRNFLLPTEQAEWLREEAFRSRRPQAEIVREALTAYRVRSETEPVPGGEGNANRALTERFRLGRGVDLDVLRDETGQMWRHDG